MKYRQDRLNKELMRILNNALLYKINDERLSWITISDVSISPDLQIAKVFFTQLSDEADPKESIGLLSKASGFLKNEIAETQVMRRIPELVFVFDDTEKKARSIENILDNLSKEKKED
ncbi:MAG: 30S ribosome-binding factor RbfA [Candidatus Cloacimonas sp.]|jgi:ribosome-binding factor A|nr:30S ribosome-binding factor RbfA [Candidatus Cloacimonadota bacterium]